MIAAASLATVFRATSASVAQKPKLDSYPRQPLNLADRVKLGSDFYQFRDRLRQAVRRRNAKFIRSIATPDIRLSFGNPITLNDLDIDNPQAPIWLGMEKAFSTGCAEVDQTKTWVCPHISAILPENLDPFEHFAIVGVNVNARSQPSINSEVIGVLSNEAVKFDRKAPPGSYNSGNPNSWVPIVLPSGRRGYVLNRYVYSSFGYRGYFVKKKGEWKMNAFVAGD